MMLGFSAAEMASVSAKKATREFMDLKMLDSGDWKEEIPFVTKIRDVRNLVRKLGFQL